MKWRVGGAVTQRSAKPFRRVRLSYVPPSEYETPGYWAFLLFFKQFFQFWKSWLEKVIAVFKNMRLGGR